MIREGYDLDFLPSTGKPASFFELAANPRLLSDELKGTLPDKLSYPSIPRVG
jgi:hypothetical protein